MGDKERLFLVTGGAGFIGSNLIEALNRKNPNAQIVSVDNYSTGSKINHIPVSKVEYITGDTVDLAEIWKESGLPAPDIVFHLGEYARIVQSFEDIDVLWTFNVDGTKAVLKFAQEKGAKLIYAGSSSKFGNQGRDENLSPYSWVKAKNVELIKNWKVWFDGPNYVITYFYNVYGPRQICTGRYSTVIGIFEEQYKRGEALTVRQPGTQTRDFTHVSDIVEGIMICAEKGNGDDYQLGAGREKSILEIARLFGAEIRMIPAVKGERKRGHATSDKVTKLGWTPQVRIEDYIADFVAQVKRERGQ